MNRPSRWSSAFAAVIALFAALFAAAQPKNDFRFCVLGDRTGDAQPGVYERVWRDVTGLHPDFVINAGDTIEGGNDATAEAEWRALRPLWSRYRGGVYFTPGNHDIWSRLSRQIYERETGRPAFYSFDYQSAHFTVLDNSETEDLSESQMEFLAHDLEAHKNNDPKFVLFHKPFWLIPVKFHSSQFPFHQLLKKYGVQYVISGHAHHFGSTLDDGIVCIEAGSSAGKLKGHGFESGWFFGFVDARVSGSQVKMTAHELGSPFGEGRSLPIASTIQ